mmetsp:Transcript_37177/g.71294  ORF Transcript_37177/g.71294 Transcript_37177/m.71294 type:complete len:99 (-) Transcript_37177:696-992(-)
MATMTALGKTGNTTTCPTDPQVVSVQTTLIATRHTATDEAAAAATAIAVDSQVTWPVTAPRRMSRIAEERALAVDAGVQALGTGYSCLTSVLRPAGKI